MNSTPFTTEIVLFLSTFLLVFFLGIQSLNVNRGHYTAAFFTSFGIGISNLILYKLAPHANGSEVAAYLLGGPFGILAAMRSHDWLARHLSSRAKKDE